MVHDESSLWENIQVAGKCKNAWDGMRGDDQIRLCQQCGLRVYNFSDLSPESARDLLLQMEGRLPRKVFRRADGTFLVKDCPVGATVSWERQLSGQISAGERKELLLDLCHELGGQYVDGGFFGYTCARFPYRKWVITLDVLRAGRSGGMTRIRVPFVSQDHLRLQVYRQDFLSSVASKIGMRDVIIGDPEFDRQYVVLSDSEYQTRGLLANSQIRKTLLSVHGVVVKITDDDGLFGTKFPEAVDQLILTVDMEVTELQQLKAFISMFAVALDQLTLIGSASEEDPGVTLGL